MRLSESDDEMRLPARETIAVRRAMPDVLAAAPLSAMAWARRLDVGSTTRRARHHCIAGLRPRYRGFLTIVERRRKRERSVKLASAPREFRASSFAFEGTRLSSLASLRRHRLDGEPHFDATSRRARHRSPRGCLVLAGGLASIRTLRLQPARVLAQLDPLVDSRPSLDSARE